MRGMLSLLPRITVVPAKAKNTVHSRNQQGRLSMNKKEAPGAWLIVGVLFVSWFVVWGGGANTGAVSVSYTHLDVYKRQP